MAITSGPAMAGSGSPVPAPHGKIPIADQFDLRPTEKSSSDSAIWKSLPLRSRVFPGHRAYRFEHRADLRIDCTTVVPERQQSSDWDQFPHSLRHESAVLATPGTLEEDRQSAPPTRWFPDRNRHRLGAIIGRTPSAILVCLDAICGLSISAVSACRLFPGCRVYLSLGSSGCDARPSSGRGGRQG